MDELVRWLGQQIDEDEEAARATAEEFGAVWTVAMEGVQSDKGADVVDEPNSPYAHIARHDPARVLREIEAKRDLLRVAEAAHDYHETFVTGFASALEGTLRLYASAYKDRPGYRSEWTP
ncbi:DUF6221 family protein [Streptomyces mirabilis]|uniref:DUF6221 family protein n=1 Tax=Streptomyces mirabilis TaxID=68239 RepID=UPI0033D2310D